MVLSKGDGKLFLWLFSSLLLLLVTQAAKGQTSVTQKQQQAIREAAYGRVELFTRYLSLLGREQDLEKIKMYKKYLKLSLMDQKEPVRVYNDLLPPSVLETNPIPDPFTAFDDYLSQIRENYSRSVKLNYSDLLPKSVCYSDFLKRYFIVVNASREISGLYRNENELTEHKNLASIDFYVSLTMDKEKGFSVGGIFGFEPHGKDQNFTELTVTDQEQESAELIQHFYEPVKILPAKKKVKIKRGKPHTLKWSGGLKDDIIEVQLISLNGDTPDTINFEPVRNRNSVTILIDENLRRGRYKFRIINISSGKYTQTGQIKVKKKYLFFWAAGTGSQDFISGYFARITARKAFGLFIHSQGRKPVQILAGSDFKDLQDENLNSSLVCG